MKRQEGSTGVEEDDGAQAAQLRLVHLHVPHLGHQLRQHPAGEAGKCRRPKSDHDPHRTRQEPQSAREARCGPGGQLRRARRPGELPSLSHPAPGAPCLFLEKVCEWDFILGGQRLKRNLVTAGASQGPARPGQSPLPHVPTGMQTRHSGLSTAFLPLPGVRPQEGISPAPGLPGSFLAAGAGSVPLPDTSHLLHSHHRHLSSSWNHRTVSWVRDWGCTSKHAPRGTCSPKKPSVGNKPRAPQPLLVALLYTSSLKALKRPVAKTHPYTV